MSATSADRGSSARLDAERVFVTVLLAIRAVILVVALAALVTAWSQFRRPGLALVAFLVVTGESGWLAVRARRRGSVTDPAIAGADALAGIVAVVSCGVAIAAGHRLTALNWGNVFAITCVVPTAAVAHRSFAPGLATSAVLALITLTLASSSAKDGNGQTNLDVVSTGVYFLGLFGAARYIQAKVRGWAQERDRLERLREMAKRELTIEQERNRQHRLLHDTALQVMEAIASGAVVDEAVRAGCRRDAARLRRAMRGEEPEPAHELMTTLSNLVEEFAEAGIHVELTAAEIQGDPSRESVEAITWAAREAIANVKRHSRVNHAVLHARDRDGGVEVVVRDHGRGFDPEKEGGFGLSNSIHRRIEEAGGTAEVWSHPGRGTRVTMWVPR